MWDLCSLTRDQTHAPWSGSSESQPQDCQGSPTPVFGSSFWVLQTQSSLLSISVFHLFPDPPTSAARMRNRLWRLHPERLWGDCCPGWLSHRVSAPLWCGTILTREPETQSSISPCSRLSTAFLLACLQTPYISYLRVSDVIRGSPLKHFSLWYRGGASSHWKKQTHSFLPAKSIHETS